MTTPEARAVHGVLARKVLERIRRIKGEEEKEKETDGSSSPVTTIAGDHALIETCALCVILRDFGEEDEAASYYQRLLRYTCALIEAYIQLIEMECRAMMTVARSRDILTGLTEWQDCIPVLRMKMPDPPPSAIPPPTPEELKKDERGSIQFWRNMLVQYMDEGLHREVGLSYEMLNLAVLMGDGDHTHPPGIPARTKARRLRYITRRVVERVCTQLYPSREQVADGVCPLSEEGGSFFFSATGRTSMKRGPRSHNPPHK
jgi:hypothetical protein